MTAKIVFLHKRLGQTGFDILDASMKPLFQKLSFVHMKDVNFVICEKNKQIAKAIGRPVNHAWVEGTLLDAIPDTLRLTPKQLRLIDTGISVEYKSSKDLGFVIQHSQTPIETAHEIIAYNGKLKVIT